MSVNYRHQVDVPVTDIDDPDDDAIFAEENHHNDDFLTSLDYENTTTSEGLLSKFTSYFKSKSARTNDYEMLPHKDQSPQVNTPPELHDDQLPYGILNHDFSQYNISSRNVKRTLFVITVIIVGAMVLNWVYKPFESAAAVAGVTTILSNSTDNFLPTTIIISLDGFHPHYISAHRTPTLHNLLVNGYGAPYMIPSFPSSTFPNHWTLITGLYPCDHGIVGNTFYDPVLNKQFINTNPKIGGLDPDFWRGGEPIWTTAKKQGVNAAVHMWPGSEVPGIGPETDIDRYNGSEPLSSKVEKVMRWLDRKNIEERPQLILTYVPTIDLYGHKYGISGPNMTQALEYTDNFVDLMQKEIANRNLNDIVNLVIVSDHGMAPTSNDRLIYLDDLVDMKKINHIDGWPLFGLRPLPQYSVDEIYEEINHKLAKSKLSQNYNLYKVEDIPPQFQFGGKLHHHKFNYRLAPIWIFPNVGYSITTYKQMEDLGGDYRPKGVHGYNNSELLMRAIFLADGPYFRQRFKTKKIEPFANTEVYNILCDSVNITPAVNNGTGYFVGLGSKWVDELVYPDLPFDVEHLVENATYDEIWRPGAIEGVASPIATNDHPQESLYQDEGTLSLLESQKLPKPTDFEYYNNHNEGDPEKGPGKEQQQEQQGGTGNEDSLGHQVGGLIDGIIDDVGELIDDAKHVIGDGFNAIGNWFNPLDDS